MKNTPAEKIIKKFGGAGALSKLLKVNKTVVYRWTYTRENGGTNGIIPSKHHAKILELAKKQKVKLSFADFF